eukprot:TRINITY_DN17407_c0_g1_i4.p1 TRINITY_DN17407_c0_g1~~TRINITY_DN17407_c0_g1_i4.p1  ORF type:complete len:419 (-),score=30.81 TRINITY_DN17407_c0_g1_i4:245-1501(-)
MSDGGSAQSGADERGSLSPAPPTPEAVRRAKKEAAAAARSEEVAREMCEHQPPGPPLPSIAWSPEGSPDSSHTNPSEMVLMDGLDPEHTLLQEGASGLLEYTLVRESFQNGEPGPADDPVPAGREGQPQPCLSSESPSGPDTPDSGIPESAWLHRATASRHAILRKCVREAFGKWELPWRAGRRKPEPPICSMAGEEAGLSGGGPRRRPSAVQSSDEFKQQILAQWYKDPRHDSAPLRTTPWRERAERELTPTDLELLRCWTQEAPAGSKPADSMLPTSARVITPTGESRTRVSLRRQLDRARRIKSNAQAVLSGETTESEAPWDSCRGVPASRASVPGHTVRVRCDHAQSIHAQQKQRRQRTLSVSWTQVSQPAEPGVDNTSKARARDESSTLNKDQCTHSVKMALSKLWNHRNSGH